MATHRKVFFSFHYDRDVWRAGVVRNSDRIKAQDTVVGRFLDKAEWESLKRNGDRAVSNWIDTQMSGTSVTVVLIGQETASRPWVLEEIRKSYVKGNGMLGVRVHSIPDWSHGRQGEINSPGPDPFAAVVDPNDSRRTLAGRYPIYNWDDACRLYLPDYIDNAAQLAGK